MAETSFSSRDQGGYTGASATRAATAVKDKVHEEASTVVAKAMEAASSAVATTKDMASSVAQKVEDAASSFGHQAEGVVGAVGGEMKSLAGTIRDKAPGSGMVGSAASGMASSLESGGAYLQDHNLHGMAEAVTNVIRRYPLQAILAAIGVGFLVGTNLTELNMANEVLDAPEPSMASLVGGIVNDAQALIKQELALAKREVADELNKAKAAAISLSSGIGIAALGVFLLVLMLVYLLHWASSERLPLWGCYGIVGAVLVILGSGLFFLGKKRAGDVHLMPEQTIATMKDNVEWIKNQT